MWSSHSYWSRRTYTTNNEKPQQNIMASHELLIADALKLDSMRMCRYCRTVDPNFLKVLNKRKPKTMSKFADIWYQTQNASYSRNHDYNDSRYHMLNFHATFTKGTIRISIYFNSTHQQKENKTDFMQDN